MKKAIKLLSMVIITAFCLGACQANHTVSYYQDADGNTVSVTIAIDGPHDQHTSRDMVQTIKEHFELNGYKPTRTKEADRAIDIRLKTDAHAYLYGRSGLKKGYTQTDTGIVFTITDDSGNLLLDSNAYYETEPYDEITEGEYRTIGSAPYDESYIPAIVTMNYRIFGDSYMRKLQEKYLDDESDIGLLIQEMMGDAK